MSIYRTGNELDRVVIVGCGGHGQVIADILLRRHEAGGAPEPVAFVDDDPNHTGRSLLGLPVLGPLESLDDVGHGGVALGIGDNHARLRVASRLRHRGEPIVSAVHPAAVLAPDVELGDGVVVCAGVVVNTGAVIGDGAILNTGCTVDHHCDIGRFAHVSPGVHLAGTVTVEEGALVGIGTSVIPGRVIGEWSIVGAGSAVTRDIPPRSTAVGSPAAVVQRAFAGR